jgi:hypothetical protein
MDRGAEISWGAGLGLGMGVRYEYGVGSAAGDAVCAARVSQSCSWTEGTLACAHLPVVLARSSGLGQARCFDEMVPARVRACSSSRRQSRSKRSDCSVTVSRASHAGLLTG